MIDNECSKAVEKHIRDKKMTIQLIPPHNHHINAANRAIATFKEHFVTALAAVDSLCPLQLWDEFLPQVELTLNLLRFSPSNPAVLANQELYGTFNFNKTPLAPLGTKALGFNDLATHALWVPHATNGFYIGPANNHYWCLWFYIPATCRFRFLDTWWLYPTHCQVPVVSEHNQTLHTAANLLEHIGHTIPTSAGAKL